MIFSFFSFFFQKESVFQLSLMDLNCPEFNAEYAPIVVKPRGRQTINIISSKEDTILGLIEKFSDTEEIRLCAVEIMRKFDLSQFSGKNVTKLALFSIYKAGDQLRAGLVPQRLAKAMGLKMADLNQAIKLCGSAMTGVDLGCDQRNPSDYLIPTLTTIIEERLKLEPHLSITGDFIAQQETPMKSC